MGKPLTGAKKTGGYCASGKRDGRDTCLCPQCYTLVSRLYSFYKKGVRVLEPKTWLRHNSIQLSPAAVPVRIVHAQYAAGLQTAPAGGAACKGRLPCLPSSEARRLPNILAVGGMVTASEEARACVACSSLACWPPRLGSRVHLHSLRE